MDQQVNVRLLEFVSCFTKEYETKLEIYDAIIDGKITKAGKFADFACELLKKRYEVPLPVPLLLTAAEKIIRNAGVDQQNKKVQDLLCVITEFRNDKKKFREKLVNVGVELCKSFEFQFIHVTTDFGWRKAIQLLAQDAVNRSISYYSKGYEGDIFLSVIKGFSKLEPFLGVPMVSAKIRKPGFSVKFQDDSTEADWKTSSIYQKTGLLIIKNGIQEYWICKKCKKEKIKYGFRLLNPNENLENLKCTMHLCKNVPLKFKSFQYQDQENNLISKAVLKKINGEDKELAEVRIKDIIEEVRSELLEEIKDLQKVHDHNYEELIKIVEGLNVQQIFENMDHEFNKAKAHRNVILKVLQQENIQQNKKLDKILSNVSRNKLLTEDYPQFYIEKPVHLFTGRKEEILKLHGLLHDRNASTVLDRMVVLAGLGGIGKTQLVKQYIHVFCHYYDSNIIWMNAETEQSLNETFQTIARDKLKIIDLEIEGKDIGEVVQDVYKYFSQKKSLFVFDNIDDQHILKKFVPSSLLAGSNIPHFFITTRLSEWDNNVTVLNLKGLKKVEAVSFVKEGLKNCFNECIEDESAKLTETLQYFPLALHQAISYIANKNVTSDYSIQDYLDEFDQNSNILLDCQCTDDFGTIYKKTTLTTWRMTFDEILKDSRYGSKAFEIIQFLSFMASDNIRRDFFIPLFEKDDESLKSTIRLLAKFSMIDCQDKQRFFSVHRLVQEIIRIDLNFDEKFDVLSNLLQLIKDNFPQDKFGSFDTIKKELLAHSESVLQHFARLIKKSPEKEQDIEVKILCQLRYWMALEYRYLGNKEKAWFLLQKNLKLTNKRFGVTSKPSSIILFQIGNCYISRGVIEPKKAKFVFQLVLYFIKIQFGENSKLFVNCLINAGFTHSQSKDFKSYLKYCERAQIICLTQWEECEFLACWTLLNLSLAYMHLNKNEIALEILEKASDICERRSVHEIFQNQKECTDLLVACILACKSNIYAGLNMHEKQKEVLIHRLEILKWYYSPENIKIIVTLDKIATVCRRVKNYSEEMTILNHVQSISAEKCPDNLLLGIMMIQFVTAKRKYENYEGAELEERAFYHLNKYCEEYPLVLPDLGDDNENDISDEAIKRRMEKEQINILLADVLNMRALIIFCSGDRLEALKYHTKALQVYEKYNQITKKIDTLYRMGLTFYSIKPCSIQQLKGAQMCFQSHLQCHREAYKKDSPYLDTVKLALRDISLALRKAEASLCIVL